MHVRTYRANSLHDAFELIRHELGPDAYIWQTRQVRASGMAGLIGGRRCVEVLASLSRPNESRRNEAHRPDDHGIDLTQID